MCVVEGVGGMLIDTTYHPRWVCWHPYLTFLSFPSGMLPMPMMPPPFGMPVPPPGYFADWDAFRNRPVAIMGEPGYGPYDPYTRAEGGERRRRVVRRSPSPPRRERVVERVVERYEPRVKYERERQQAPPPIVHEVRRENGYQDIGTSRR